MLLNCGVAKTLESPLDCKETQSVHPKGDQSWVFIGRTDVEAETPIFWPPDVKNWLIGKDPDTGKDWRQEEKGTTEDEMVGWHHWLNGNEFRWTPAVGDGQGGLACVVHGVAKSRTWLRDWTDNHHSDQKFFPEVICENEINFYFCEKNINWEVVVNVLYFSSMFYVRFPCGKRISGSLQWFVSRRKGHFNCKNYTIKYANNYYQPYHLLAHGS